MKIKFLGRLGSVVIFSILCCLLTVANVFSQPENGRKPVLAVIEFDVRQPINYTVGRDLSDILINALLESRRFTVVDRSKMKEIQQEQIQVLMGSVDQATGAAIGKLTGAQFLLLGSVTEFKEKQSKLGGLSKWVKVPGASQVASYEAIVKFNLRVINSTTGEIAFSKTVEKKVSDTGLSGSDNVFGVTLSDSFESQAMRNAVQQAIQETVTTLIERLGSFAPPATVAEIPAVSTVDCSRVAGSNAPRVMVVIPEVHISQKIPDPAGETEIIKKLVGMKFNVVDQKQVAAIRDREKVLAAVRDAQAAASLGAEFGADIIVIGEAFSEMALRQNNLFSTRARVEARAIRTDTARILAADGKFGSGIDIAEFVSAKAALRNAGSLWADYFITQICQAPDTTAAPATTAVEIMLSNANFAQLKRFADVLATVPGVSKVEKKLTNSVARVTLEYAGGTEKLADAISEAKFVTLKANIVGLSGNKIEISIGR